ncbi:hypothetical protein [Burkholderia ambifaria]|uniref:hypothetical protein n=1 Tax=Burkholderia ambifaria TaxID=152480 RepID=UPI00158D2678|nr:hypothetical protein [Burkholderia ambifaria]
MRCVADHVDKRALFDEPTAIHLASARLVDGRAIHHYLMFIEPVLEASKARARQIECMLGEAGLMNIAARWADGERASGGDSHSTLEFFEEITAEQGAATGLWNAACRFICKWISAEHIVNGVPDIYVRRRAGDFRTPHIDGVSSPTDSRKQIAGIGVWLNDDFEGGEFAVSTVIDENLFGENRNEFVTYGVDNSVPWFRALCTTTWTAKPAAGDVLLYGSQTIHSTRPVVKGKARRLINFLTANG